MLTFDDLPEEPIDCILDIGCDMAFDVPMRVATVSHAPRLLPFSD